MISRDCVVIGGGPAGSTFASIVKKYDPGATVTLLEKERFPRYHIGESTIPVINGVFRELGVLDALERSTFVKKIGIAFVWGKDRTPWNADFLRLRNLEVGDADVIDVTGQDFAGLIDELRVRETPFTAFNVRRAEFDALLLDRSRELGVEVREGTRVTTVRRSAAGAVEGVDFEGESGETGTIETPFVLDASGLSSFMTKGQREFDPHMNNYAVYSYFAGAEWKVTYNGARDRSTVFLASVPHGWIWYFPIGPDVMSVGVVTNTAHFKDRLQQIDPEAFYWEAVRSCPEVSGLLKNATVRTDILPDGKRVGVSRDWSSVARTPCGDGWAAAGDALVFVDPILSSGVTLAIQAGHRAAYTFNTVRARPDLSARELWGAYADYARGEASSFLTLARYFYGNNRAAESWWWEAQRLLNKAGRLQLDDHQSFTMAVAGFFPTPRAISQEVVGALLNHLSDARADINDVFRRSGVPEGDELARSAFEAVVPFRLALRTEPSERGGAPGQLFVYHDLVTDDPRLMHRLAAAPCRIPPALAPVVDAIPRHRDVASLIDEAQQILGAAHDSGAIRQATLDVVRAAVMKGFLRLVS